jgi:hypothetical protein
MVRIPFTEKGSVFIFLPSTSIDEKRAHGCILLQCDAISWEDKLKTSTGRRRGQPLDQPDFTYIRNTYNIIRIMIDNASDIYTKKFKLVKNEHARYTFEKYER